MPKPDPCVPFITQTADWLYSHLPEGLTFRYYNHAELRTAVANGEVDVVLSEAGTAGEMQKYGARPMMTAVSKRHPDPVHAQGSVIIVRKDSSVRTVRDLRQARIAATAPDDFTGYWAALGEIKKHGLDPERFYDHTSFVGSSSKAGMSHVVGMVESGEADAGIVRTCFLEDLRKLENREADVRVINAYPKDDFSCVRSTQTYPNWTIFTTVAPSPELLRDVARLLLEMPRTDDGLYWSIAPDFNSVTDLMKELMIGPYEILRDWTLRQFVSRYLAWIIGVLSIIAGLMGHHLRSTTLVRKMERELRRSFAEREKLSEKFHETERQLENVQKATIVGQISNIFAHEIKQPLHTLNCYAHGLSRAIDTGRADIGAFRDGLCNIESAAQEIGGIVDQVRAYTKGRDVSREPLVFNDVLCQVRERFAGQCEMKVEGPAGDVCVLANELELQLIISNLVKNAIQAAQESEHPLVRVRFSTTSGDGAGNLVWTVEDSGPGVDGGAISALGRNIYSAKKDGLGMGLIVVSALVRRYDGEIAFGHSSLGGLLVTVRLPLAAPAGRATDAADPGERGSSQVGVA